MKQNNNTKFERDYIIIGAGPAGVQLGYFLEKEGRDYLILEANNAPASFFSTYPRHRKLLSINKCYTGYDDPEINLRWDWNSLLCEEQEKSFRNYTKKYFPDADDLVNYVTDFARHFALKIKYGVRVQHISKNRKFHLFDQKGRAYVCKRLIVATGISIPYIPEIPGIELTENYINVSVDPEDFINQRVLIIGKGNSAFETADNLIETTQSVHICSPHSLNLAWKTHYPGHLRAVNNNVLDTYHLKSQNAILDAEIEKIALINEEYHVTLSYLHADGEVERLVYDRVITCTGFRFDDSIFDDSCKPVLSSNIKYPAQTSEWESVNVEDLYFAGTLMHVRDYKKSNSSFIHGFRYNVKALFRMLEVKYQDKPWPCQTILMDKDDLTNAVIERINQTSALWQQFGFLGDLFLLSENEAFVEHFSEMPLDYIEEQVSDQSTYYTLTLEYGEHDDHFDPFSMDRISRTDTKQADRSAFLHPVIRCYASQKLVHEHHIIEDLAAEWWEEEHIQPLKEFFNKTTKELQKQPQSVSELLPA